MFSKTNVVLLTVILLLWTSSCDRQQATSIQPSTLTVVSYGGGAYQESHKKAFIEPFAEATGLSIESLTWNADYGKLKSMVASGRVPWDIVEVTAGQFLRGKNENLFEKLDVKPTNGEFLPNVVEDYGVANGYWGTVLAYVKDEFPTSPPISWRDFWNTRGYPGPRAMYDDPRGNLEIALLADGVPAKSLYPLDVQRAFRKLDEIKPHVRVWWTDGVQPLQLLLTKSVLLTTIWNTRIYASSEAQRIVGYSWDGAPMELDYWIIPRGSKNRPAASRFIRFASKPFNVGRQTAMVGYGPVNKTALDYVPEQKRVQLPTYSANWDKTFSVNAAWWSEHEQDMKTRWLAWKQK
jgi:putative spermidine/putrescine transport system substrate-binding protein